ELCDRVAIMNKGRLIDVDTPQNFISRLGRYVVEWREDVHREFRFFDSREEARTFIGSLETTASIRKSHLEDIFIELTGRKEGL
ncbi:MAG: ABC transporter ATP-binding protein, partial [Acidaminococcaceae bacterium]|nr:ABC transporter ATP-binding protein [Acidaminococcaceae bacterium]